MIDFFISLNSKDKAWGDWIAWQLKAAGYKLIYQHWHFQTGQNFVLHMEEAGRKAKRVLIVLSDHYFSSEYTLAELTQALSRDPSGRTGTIVPVRISDCDIAGSLLGPRSYIDLSQITEESEARARLLEGLELKKPPDTEPPFPNKHEDSAKEQPVYPGKTELRLEDAASPRQHASNERSALEHTGTKDNPYDPWTPVIPPRFFGRERLLGELERGLEESRSLSLVGDWRIGKSSLLITWQRAAEAKGRVVRLVSGEGPEGVSVKAFVKAIGGFDAPDDADGAADVLSRWAEISGAPGLTPLIPVDEVDGLLPLFEHRFFERLRGMLGRICLMLCSRRELDKVYEDLGRGSPFHNRLQLLWIGLLEPEAAEDVIRGWVMYFWMKKMPH